jgi:ATP-binding protein involved in chromosome partitioning
MAVTEQAHGRPQGVVDSNTGRDFVSTKALKNLTVSGGDVAFDIETGLPGQEPDCRHCARPWWPLPRRRGGG